MSTYKLTPQERRARMQVLAAQRRATVQNRAKTGAYRTSKAVQPTASAVSTPKNDTNILLRLSATQADLASNVITGALKSFEGIFDFGAGIVGAVGGIFSEDFQEGVQNVIEYDAVGNWVGDPLDELFSDSLLEDSKTGQIIEAVASGVGQMLPAVAVTVATGGAAAHSMAAAGTQTAAQIAAAAAKAKQISQIASLATTAVGAAGNATEEAFKDGADYYQGLGYGAASGAVEAATEKLMGGPTKNLYGPGWFDGIFKSAAKESAKSAVKAGAKVGAKSVIKGMVEEGAEEALTALASPALKSIYKGRDAFSEYGEGEYWSGVGEAALVGGLTSAVYGGTLGKVKALGGQSAIERDAGNVFEDIEQLEKTRDKLDSRGTLSREQAINIEKTIKADMELLEKQLQKVSPQKRAQALEGGLNQFFDENGNLLDEQRAKLDKNISAAADTTYDHRYRSIELDSNTIGKALGKKGATAFSGEMDAEQQTNLHEMKRALNAMSRKEGGSLGYVIAQGMENDNAYIDPESNVIVIDESLLKNGNSMTELAKQWIGSVVHEGAHSTEGTFRAEALNALLKSDNDIYTEAASQYLSRGYSRDFLGKDNTEARKKLIELLKKAEAGEELTEQEKTVRAEFESESYAFASQAVLGSEKFIRHLVKEDLGTVEKILGKISDIKDALKNRKNADAKKAAEFVKAAEKLYLGALDEVGAKYQNGKIIGAIQDDEEEERNVSSGETVKESRKQTEPKSWENNIRLSDNDLPEYMSAGKTLHTRNKKQRMFELGKKPILTSSQEISDFISDAIKGKAPGEVRAFGRVGEKLSKAVLKIRKTLDVNKKYLELNADDLRESYKRHSEPKEKGDIALSVQDFEKIPDYIDNFDGITSIDTYNGKTEIHLYKRNQDGYVRIITISSSERNALQVSKLIGVSKEKFEQKYAKKIERNTGSPRSHSEITDNSNPSTKARHTAGVLSNNSISQNDTDVNNKIKNSQKEKSNYSLSSEDKASLNDELRQLAFYDDLDIREDTHDTPPIPDTPPREKKTHTSKPTQTKNLTDKQIKKLISEQTNSIKYTKTEAKSVLYDILENDLSFGEHYGKLKGKSNQEIISMLWRGLSLTEPGKRFGTALDIAEYILASSVINNVQANNVLELYEAWKSVRSQSDVDNLKAFATELEKFNIEIKGETKEELISQIDAAFKGAREDAKKDAKQAFDSFLSTEERKAKKQEIAKKILYAFDEKGTPSKSGELIAKMEQEMLSAIQKYNEGREYNKTKNRLLYKLRDIENLKKGRFLNASQFKVDIFKNSIERLAKIAHQGNINESGTRDVLKGILSWYDVKENPILSEDHYNKEIRKSLQGIVSGEGELSLEELKDLENIVKFFYWFEKNYNKVWENGKRVDALPKAKKFLEIIKANSELKVGGLRKLFVDKYGRTFFDPMSLVRYMDRYEQGFYTEMLEQLREGALAAQEMEMEIREPLEEFYEKHKKFLKDIRNKTIKYQDSDIPITQAMLLYMTLNRKHALAGLASSGFTYFDGKKQIKLKGFLSNSTQEPDALTIEAKAKEIQAELSNQFSDAEMEYISIAENIFNVVCKDIKYDTDMNRQGYSNVLDDYYVPIVRATIANTVDTSSFFSEMLRASNASFNKDVVKGAKNKLYIESLDKVLDRHIKAMSLYANLATIIDDYNTLYNLDVSENPNDPESIASESANSEWNKSVDRQVGDRVRDEANEYFKKLISDIQGISPVKGDGNKFVGSIRRNYARYQLGANLKVLFTQTTSFAAAGSILDYDCLLKGFSISGKDVDEYCSLAKLRNSENTVAKAQGVLDHTGNLGDVLLKPVGKTDRIIVRKLFAACQAQIEKDKKLTVGTEENKRAAGELLKRVILETQQNSLATERSAAMRSGNELVKTLTMFSADSMKSIGRLIDGIGRYSVVKKKLNLATDSSEKAKLNFELKEAGKQARKAMTSILTTAIQMGLIALFFRWLRGKLDKEEDAGTIILSTVIDSASNLLGGLPIYKDIASYLIDGYELENYAYSAINDILSTYKNLFDTAPKVFSGEADTQDVWSGIRNITFSTGQLFGIPSRNIYNSIRSIVGIASPSAAYNMDNMLYNKNYSSDLAKAVENEDEDMISTIAGLMLNENVGGIDSEAARTELDRLVTKGFDVIPRGVGDSFTYDGETYELNAREKKAFSRIYTVANEALGDMVKLSVYKEADDEVKAKAIKFIYDTYRSLAIQDFLDEDIESKTVLMAEAIDIEKLALIVATARSLTADTDKQGKAISGSRKQKVLGYINSLKLTAAQKFMIAGFLGYKNIHGEDKVKAYINTLKLTKQEKSRLLEYSGYSAA